MADRILNYGRHCIEPDDVDAVVRVLRGDLITQGPVVERFEAAIAERVGARYAVAVSSGTAGLHVACLAAGAAPSHGGVTSAITFAASANALLYCGAGADLVDIDLGTLGMAPTSLARHLDKRPDTAVVLPVHMAGLAADMREIRAVAGSRVIIEDASHALGGNYSTGRPVGCCDDTDMAVFSFHPVKPITTGEGGIVVTNDTDLAKRLRMLRNHGIEKSPDGFIDHDQAFPDGSILAPWYQEQQLLGYNYRMSEIHAALGLAQLGKIDRFLDRRREIAACYDAAFAGRATVRPYQASVDARARSALHLYIIDLDFDALGMTRTEFIKHMYAQGIGTQVHYLPVFRHPFHRQRLGDMAGRCTNAERYYRGCLSIPFFPNMEAHEVSRVVATINGLCD